VRARIAEEGERFNSLMVIEYRKGTHTKRARYLVICDCGRRYRILSFSLVNGETKRCRRCADKKLSKDVKKRYGYSEIIPDDTLRKMWLNRHKGIMQRCYNKNADNYDTYGGRGIDVCDRWHDRMSFLKDIVRLEGWTNKKLQLDRTENELGYGPFNCKMVTAVENCNNRRTSKKNRQPKSAEALQEEIDDEKPF